MKNLWILFLFLFQFLILSLGISRSYASEDENLENLRRELDSLERSIEKLAKRRTEASVNPMTITPMGKSERSKNQDSQVPQRIKNPSVPEESENRLTEDEVLNEQSKISFLDPSEFPE